MRHILTLVLLTLTLAACAPVGNVAREITERPDGASLAYLTDGLGFDPGSETANDVQIRATGTNLVLHPDQDNCEVQEDVLACDLGDVENRTVVRFTGVDVLANVSFRREARVGIFIVNAR